MPERKQIKPKDVDARAVACAVTETDDGGKTPEEISERSRAENVDKAADDLGKFASLQELLSAYNALQSEFTKRCQLIKRLQARLDDIDAQAQAVAAAGENAEETGASVEAPVAAEAPARYLIAQSSVRDGEARLAEAVAVIAENIDECADYLATLPQIADAVILTYKKKLLDGRTAAPPRGMAVVMPALRPKTLADAKRLADEMLKRK